MVRLILLTVAALFGVLALFGTPEFSGSNNGTIPQPAAGLSAPPAAPAAVRHSSVLPASISEALMTAALFTPPAAPRPEGPRLQASPEHARPAAQTTQTAPASAGSFYVTTDGVNLREEPEASAQVIATLGRGNILGPFGPADGAWVEVESAGQRGFVSARYLSTRPPG